MAESKTSVVINAENVEEIEYLVGEHYGGYYKALTPAMEPGGGSLGMSLHRVPPGRTFCPFHYHQLEDEVFFMLSGRGKLRYGEELIELRPGDCVSCPAGTQTAHQILNTGNEDLVYLCAGRNDANEVCVYPDNGKVLVRSIKCVGFLEKADYMANEPEPPKIVELAAKG